MRSPRVGWGQAVMSFVDDAGVAKPHPQFACHSTRWPSLGREWAELSRPRGSVILLDLALARPTPGWRCVALRVYWPHRKRAMPNKSSSSSGAAVLDRERVLADLRHVLTALVARRGGVRVGWRLRSLARGNWLSPPTDTLV